MSRPTVRTPENRERIVALLAEGTTRTAACAAVRMSRDTLHEWLRDDEEFALEVEEAVQAAITRSVRVLHRAAQPRKVKKTRTEYGPAPRDAEGNAVPGAKPVVVARTVEEHVEEGDWRAAAWFLERTAPEDFGRKDTLRLLPPEKMSNEDLVAELAAVAQRAGLAGGGPEAGPDAPPDV